MSQYHHSQSTAEAIIDLYRTDRLIAVREILAFFLDLSGYQDFNLEKYYTANEQAMIKRLEGFSDENLHVRTRRVENAQKQFVIVISFFNPER